MPSMVIMRQHRWLELINDYNLNIHPIPPRHAYVVANALSRKSYCSNMMVREKQLELCDELKKLKFAIAEQGQLSRLTIKSDLKDRIEQAQKQYQKSGS